MDQSWFTVLPLINVNWKILSTVFGSRRSTCGKCGFTKSFDIFQASTTSQSTSGCERIISFLTDGIMNQKNWVDGWMTDKISQLTGPAPHIFTYALGSGAETEIPAKLACKYNGWFTKIEKKILPH